ncbi:MAG: hypothetical protein NTW06_01735 [Candidatus Falkowbacteria bacterium]|nr:hypothetical protein [Candidatus Falkowbacteria bacterium]
MDEKQQQKERFLQELRSLDLRKDLRDGRWSYLTYLATFLKRIKGFDPQGIRAHQIAEDMDKEDEKCEKG